MTHTNYNSTTN